jgi:hypothetical protein
LEKFHAALKFYPLSNAIFNVGSMLYTLRQYEDAFPYLDQTLRAPLDPRQREIVTNHIDTVFAQLRASHGAVLVETSPPGATITINGKEMPFVSPMRVLIPFGAADVMAVTAGFKPNTVVVNSSRADMPKDMKIRLEREEPDAPVSVRCPGGADVFIDGQMHGFELVRLRLLLGPHVVRCGKTQKSQAFERAVEVRPGPNAFEFSNQVK